MQWTGFLLVLVLVTVVRTENEIRNIASVNFDKTETFVKSTSSVVYHMELDLYKADGSILFVDRYYLKTSDGKLTTTVMSGFSNPVGFKQINRTHVVVVDHGYHCIWMVNRADKPERKLLAGVINSNGYIDGYPGKFYSPWGIQLDERNPGYLLVTDYNNRALRSIEIETGNVSTVIPRYGLNYPRGMLWDDGQLLVATDKYISEVSWSKNDSVANTTLAGSTTDRGYRDGDFKSSLFYNPHEITALRDNLYLVADSSNSKLRLLDYLHRRVAPVCIGNTASCTIGTNVRSYSVLATNDAVYVGRGGYITKLTGFNCYTQNITAYVYPYAETADVKLDDDDVGVFPPGVYQYKRKRGSDRCVFYANVFTSPIIRTATFRSSYDVTCAALDNHISRAFLQSILAHRNKELQKTCGIHCQMSSRLQPWFKCENNVLTVSWPTDDVFPVDVKAVPQKLNSRLRNTAEASTLQDVEMVLLSHVPPVVKPRRNKKGEAVEIVLTSACAQRSQKYQESADTCA